MSELGNINKSLGKQVNISVANTYSENVLNSKVLPTNTLIISSPIDNNGNDIGTYCLLVTDNNGTGVRLSYTIQPGNGLNIENENTDVLKLDIDKTALNVNSNDELQVNISYIADNKTIISNNNKLQVNVQNLPTATDSENGLVMIDNLTTKIYSNGNLYIDSENLDKANENSYGVVISDNNTIYINSNGVVSVNTNNLSYATNETYGVVKVDGNTINSTQGNISVNTENLNYCSDSYFGIVKPDGNIISANNGELFVNTQKINRASNTQYGVTKVDGTSLIENNGVLSMNKYDEILNHISNLNAQLGVIETTLFKIDEKLSQIR